MATETATSQAPKTAKNTGASAAVDDLTPDIGNLDGHQKIGVEINKFYVAKIANDPKRLNPLRGIITEVKFRKPELKDPKVPSAGYAEAKRYFIMLATGRFVVSMGEGDDKKQVLCDKGDFVWVDERYKFQDFDKFLPRVLPNGQTVALEVAFVPEKVVSLAGGRSVIRGQVTGEVLSPEVTKQLGIDGTIRKFTQMGGADAPRALLGQGESSEIPF